VAGFTNSPVKVDATARSELSAQAAAMSEPTPVVPAASTMLFSPSYAPTNPVVNPTVTSSKTF
jgi:hypothetical protein